MPPEYERTVPFSGDPDVVFHEFERTLAEEGFRVVHEDRESMEVAGPGMTSSKQPAIRGAGTIRLMRRHGLLSIEADMAGVERIHRFLRIFLSSMAVGFLILFGPIMGWVFGRIFGVGFGVPFAPGWDWLLFIGPIVTLPFLPWILLTPIVCRRLRTRARLALDDLMARLSALSHA